MEQIILCSRQVLAVVMETSIKILVLKNGWADLLNQAHAGRRPAHAWFLNIASVRELQYVCVCVRPRGY